ncbi:LysR family transcriptional regulator [Pseudovibrio exalbescens]|uniref:LysR family transcriptional regulator n=1 Tax=Pseudovibrio exalbescens TaxID=197461 RepID=UPI0023656CC2|nr:LysR family transcriptional regulator [Pseudovibrio exalbescens]MDD7908337.1 LysR family transcriptional regulator [Pseudovibrio exalbescens]
MRPSDVLNWDDLKLVLALAETGYVNQSAERLKMDATTVPRRIRKLEETLGIKLVERIKGGVVLAPVADDLVDLARRLEGGVNQALAGAAEEDEISGVVKVSATDFTFELIAPELTGMLSELPKVQLDMRPGNTYLSLEKRETDIAVRLVDAPNEGLVGRRLGPIRTAVYGTGKWAQQTSGFDWLSWNLPKGLTANDGIIDDFDPKGRVVARVDSMITQAKFVAEGMGVARLPCAYVEQRGDLSALRNLGNMPSEQAWVLTHEELRNVPRIKSTMSAIAEAFSRFS